MMSMEQRDFILAEGEHHVQCPYSRAHIITNAKLLIHLQKCRKQYEKDCAAAGKRPDIKQCRFNDKHRFNAPEIAFHEDRCEDAVKVVETIRYHGSAEFHKRQEEDRRRQQEAKDAMEAEAEAERRRQKHKHKHDDRDRGHSSKYDRDRGSSSSKDRPVDRVYFDRDREAGHSSGRGSHHQEQDEDGFINVSNKKSRDRDRDGGRGWEQNRNMMPPPVDVKPVITKPPPPKSNTEIWGNDSEDWEADSRGYEAAYDPQEKLKSGIYLYQPRGLQPAERKQYRLEQHIKAASILHQGYEMDQEEEEEDNGVGGWDESMEIEPSKPDVKPNISIKREPSRSPPRQERHQGRQASSSSSSQSQSQSQYTTTTASKRKKTPSSATRDGGGGGGRHHDPKEDGEVSDGEDLDFEPFYGDDPFSVYLSK